MRLHVLIALGISSALVLGTTALAQQPAPSTPPAASPGPAPAPPPDYGPPIVAAADMLCNIANLFVAIAQAGSLSSPGSPA